MLSFCCDMAFEYGFYFDDMPCDLDLYRCEPLACSEVRAAREGECRNGFVGDSGVYYRTAVSWIISENHFDAVCGMAEINPSDLPESANSTFGKVREWFDPTKRSQLPAVHVSSNHMKMVADKHNLVIAGCT